MQPKPLYWPITIFLKLIVISFKSFACILIILSSINQVIFCLNEQRRASPAYITSRFNDVSAMVGDDDITFKCAAIGYPKPVITWYSSKSFHRPDSKVISKPPYVVSGEMLTVKTTKELNRHFFCRAANKYGTALLSPVHVQVFDRNAFGTNTRVYVENIYLSKNYVMKCYTKPTYVLKNRCRWQINSRNLPISDRYSYDDQGNLYFIQIRREDSANYTCACPTNFKGSTLSKGSKTTLILKDAKENITRKMSIWYVSDDAEKMVNSRHSMRCIPDGIPIPKVMWMKDGKPLSKSSHTTLRDNNRHLEIRNLKDSDDGKYTCYLMGDSSIRQDIHLKVVSKPIATAIFSPFVLFGHNKLFTCEGRTANGHSHVNGSWLINAIEKNFYYNTSMFVIRGSTLTIQSADFPRHLMTATCHLKNRYGATLVGYGISVINKTQILKKMITLQYKKESNFVYVTNNNVKVDPGVLVTIQIFAKADTLVQNKLRYTWYKNKHEITSRNTSESIYIIYNSPNVLVLNDSLEKLGYAISDVYKCRISIDNYEDADIWAEATIKSSITKEKTKGLELLANFDGSDKVFSLLFVGIALTIVSAYLAGYIITKPKTKVQPLNDAEESNDEKTEKNSKNADQTTSE